MDRVFEEEQRHLSETYAVLRRLEKTVSERLAANLAEVQEFKSTMNEELSLDFDRDSADVDMETFAEFDVMNNVVDSFNISIDMDTENLGRIRRLLSKAYFAKVSLQFPGKAAPRDIYLGSTGMSDENYRQFIVDWRSPVAETYYNQQTGPMSYVANGRTVNVDLKLRRQFDVDHDRLNSYFDTTVAIEDSLLLNALRRHHSEKLQAITATIQREQNEIVRHEDVPVMLVNGIAGSGKTSVMLQRIAYLLYHNHETLNADQVYLFSPNEVFERYIDGVLPSMGEANPRLYTWRDFVEEQGAGNRDDGSSTPVESLERLEREIAGLSITVDDLRAVTVDDVTLLNTGQIASVVEKHAKWGIGPRFIALVTDELHERLDRRLSGMSRADEWQERVLGLDVETQIQILGAVTDTSDEDEIARATRRYVDHLFAAAEGQIDNLSWLRLDRMGMRMLDQKTLSASELLYLRLLICGRGASDARYVMVDEVQDYSAAQLMVLSRFFGSAHFLLLGDRNQAIREGTASFEQIQEIFEATHGRVDVCRLLTSYRSSPEVTAVFSKLVNMGDDIKLASVRREGLEPRRELFSDESALAAALGEVVARAQGDATDESAGLTAIVALDGASAYRIAKLLDGRVPVLKKNQSLPATGVVIVTLAMAKGLEFDHVVIPDADAASYPESPLARRRLYTAVSRAMHQVTLFAQGEFSPLLG